MTTKEYYKMAHLLQENWRYFNIRAIANSADVNYESLRSAINKNTVVSLHNYPKIVDVMKTILINKVDEVVKIEPNSDEVNTCLQFSEGTGIACTKQCLNCKRYDKE